MTRIFLERLSNGYQGPIARAFDYLRRGAPIPSGARVCIKPNLTYPTFRKGVMTNPEAIEAMIVYLKDFTENITICESDSGGYNPFSMDEVFAETGLTDMSRRYGVRIVNLSKMPARSIPCRTPLRRLHVPLPRLVLDDTDLFITMPVPKIHMNTVVSLAIKNQWGVIQDPSLRLKLHPYFQYVIHAVNRALPPAIAFFDGRYGLTRSGPMRGDVVDLNWIAAADSVFYADFLVTRLMGLDPMRVPYLRHILRREKITSLDGVELNVAPESFMSTQFHLQREWTDYPGLLAFKSRLLAYLGYESALAKPLHWLLYRFREPFY